MFEAISNQSKEPVLEPILLLEPVLEPVQDPVLQQCVHDHRYGYS